ncbi:hypothetical protein CICLE_v10002565mg [Citrus x clementina]|uniref:Protein DCL, chloroplastic n=1 Tax=Citrus clementina TaxID=85681 RepID=V4SJN6_CITCL|nr:protein DCL, chloroplastic [Citrus x clementina]ESR47943.1 hypothetical protein CICLE_v10002565mg [Citrus x clementina]
MASPMLFWGLPLLRFRPAARLLGLPRATFCSAAPSEPTQPEEKLSSADNNTTTLLTVKEPPKYHRWADPDYRKWKDKEDEILRDIEPILFLAKEILHSRRYMDGERLTADDERAVVEKLLAYHPHSEDKIGCGLDAIMVDRHPQFGNSRCLFVVRTDGGWIDFSYQKCLRAYIRDKYPSHAERFIREHFSRGSG